MLLVSRSMGYSFLQSINQVLLVQLGGVLHLAGDPSGEARLSKLCCWHQCPAFQGISFRDGIFLKSRDPGIFRDGICVIFLSRDFLEIVRDFSGYFCLIRLVINLNIFYEQESPANNFSIRKTDQLIVGEMICKDLHMPYRNF